MRDMGRSKRAQSTGRSISFEYGWSSQILAEGRGEEAAQPPVKGQDKTRGSAREKQDNQDKQRERMAAAPEEWEILLKDLSVQLS
jgi:hypothetical protein